MNFSTFCRRTLLASGLAILGISSALAADWPRQITDSRGTHTLESQPLRIVSTSVTLTGSLLAIDAPVVASGATTPNNRVADGQDFYVSGAMWRKRGSCRASTLANRALRPSLRKCRI